MERQHSQLLAVGAHPGATVSAPTFPCDSSKISLDMILLPAPVCPVEFLPSVSNICSLLFLILKKEKEASEITLFSVCQRPLPLTLLGNGSVNTFLQQRIRTQQ
jgi:hypothetical protein